MTKAKKDETPHQEVLVTLKLRLWLPQEKPDGELFETDDISTYVRTAIYAGFPEHMEQYDGEQLLDIREIEEERDLYHPTQERAMELVQAAHKELQERLAVLDETLDK